MNVTPNQRHAGNRSLAAAKIVIADCKESAKRVDEIMERVRKMIEEKRGE